MNWKKLDVPGHYEAMYRRAMTGKSRQAAIRIYCLMCVGWVPSEVHRCTAPGCPLYTFRDRGGGHYATGRDLPSSEHMDKLGV